MYIMEHAFFFQGIKKKIITYITKKKKRKLMYKNTDGFSFDNQDEKKKESSYMIIALMRSFT